MEIKINISYTEFQKRIFWECDKRFRVVAKGRRVGFTNGCANFCVENLLESKKILWVDTINANIQRYFERYFMPILKQIPNEFWDWSKQDKKLLFKNGSVLDMRGADRPENIEGFGYDIVILNEAGIILKNAYLWDNAISPMLLDNPQSVAIIGGVPKGKNRFYDLFRNELKNDDWVSFTSSSFDNPLLSKDEINRLIDELGGAGSDIVEQEIYGRFRDNTSNLLFSLDEIENAINTDEVDDSGAVVWGVDIARFGDDKSVLSIRQGFYISNIISFSNLDTASLADEIFHLYLKADLKPQAIFIDTIGVGAGVFDILNHRSLPVREAIMSAKPLNPKFANKRAEIYFELKDKMKYLKLPPLDIVKKQALMISYFYNSKDKLQIISKDEIKKEFGSSPDELDSLAMCFYEQVFVDNEIEYWCGNGW